MGGEQRRRGVVSAHDRLWLPEEEEFEEEFKEEFEEEFEEEEGPRRPASTREGAPAGCLHHHRAGLCGARGRCAFPARFVGALAVAMVEDRGFIEERLFLLLSLLLLLLLFFFFFFFFFFVFFFFFFFFFLWLCSGEVRKHCRSVP